VGLTEEALRTVVTEYDESKRQLLARRDARLRAFHASGWRPIDLQRVTGYSRETIRHALHPEAREAANASRRKVAPSGVARPPAAQPVAYGDGKPYVVADDLGDLRGPTEGMVTLPHHLDWSGRATYDLDRPARLASMYKTVLNEAGTVKDLRNWLDQRVLIELWPTLWLPPRLRALWESRFPELAARRRPAMA
jgi:hypothetical protein